MPYVEGKWFKLGLELGEAGDRHKREKAYQEDRARALQEAEASRQAGDMRLDEYMQEAMGKVEGAAPFGVGPEPVETVAKKVEVRDRFERVKEIARRMSPQNRERFLLEERDRMQRQSQDRARQEVAKGIQDRVAIGAYNFLDETEPNPEIDARLDQLVQALDDPNTDPLKVQELDIALLDAVKKHNETMLARKRGTAMIEKALQQAIDGGNQQMAQSLESLHALWSTGALDADDLVDKLFEAQYGRKTARAQGPSPFEVRKQAIQLWQAQSGKAGLPTEEELQPYLELLSPTPATPRPGVQTRTPTREEIVRASSGQGGGSSGQPFFPEGTEPEAPPPGAGEPSNGKPPREERDFVPWMGKEMREQRRKQRGKGNAPRGTIGGAAPRPWTGLRPKERKQAAADLRAVARKGGDLRKALKSLGISDPESIPKSLQQELIDLAEKASKPTTIGRPQHQGPSEQMKQLAIEEGRRRFGGQ